MLEMQRANKVNTHRANCQNENLSGLTIMEDVEPKVQKMYDNTTKVIEDWSTYPPNRDRDEVMCHDGMCRIKEGDDQALVW